MYNLVSVTYFCCDGYEAVLIDCTKVTGWTASTAVLHIIRVRRRRCDETKAHNNTKTLQCICYETQHFLVLLLQNKSFYTHKNGFITRGLLAVILQ